MVAYASRQMKPHENSYCTHDFELASIVYGATIFMEKIVSCTPITKVLSICPLKESLT